MKSIISTIKDSKGIRNQILLILLVTVLISLVSGVHRTLISLLYNVFSTGQDNSIYSYINGNGAPLTIWLQLAFTVAPFGIAKALTDYYAGRFRKTKNVLVSGSILYLLGVLNVSILFLVPLTLSQSISGLVLPLSSGFIGAGEGFFYAGAQILLSNYATGRQRGQYLGFSEFSIYGGYTVGSLIGGFLSSGNNFLFPYSFSILVIFLTLLLHFSVVKDYKSAMMEQLEQIDMDEDEIEIEMEKNTRKANFKPRKLVKNFRILNILVGTHISKWGDALILLLPVYLALLLSPTTDVIDPDTIKISFILGAYTLTWAFGMIFTSYLTESIGRRVPVILGFFLSGSGFLALTLIPTDSVFIFEFLIIAMVMAGFGTGLYYPLMPAIGLDIAKPKYRPQTLALFRSIRDFGYFTGPIILVILVWITGSTINDLIFASAFVGILLVSFGIVFVILLLETRPSWPFFDDFVSHSYSIKKVVDKSVNSFDYKYIKNKDSDSIVKLANKAQTLEKKADTKKRNFLKYITTSVKKTDDVSDFFQLIKVIDEIGGKTAMASLKYSKLTLLFQYIPKPLFKCLVNLSQSLLPLMEDLLETIDLMDEQVALAHKRQKILVSGERVVDEYYDEFLKNLYTYEFFYSENEKFTIMMTLREVAENLEKAGDLMQEAGDLLTLMALKHKL